MADKNPGSYASTRYPDMDDPFTWIGQIAGRGARTASGAGLEYVGDTTEPPAITGLALTGSLVRNAAHGGDLVRITATWNPVEYDTTDSAITTSPDVAPINGYHISYAISGGAFTADNFVTASTATLEGLDAAAVQVTVRVRARSATAAVGPYSTATITVVKDTIPPPVPSAPIMSSRTKGVEIRWGGTFVNGEAQPSDFSHVLVEYHFGDGGWIKGGQLGSGGMFALPTTGLSSVTARLSSFDKTKNQSGFSATASSTPAKVLVGEIEVASVSAYWMETGTLNADYINTGVLTGRTIRTTSASQRVEISSGGDIISWYNSSGTQISYIQGNSYSTSGMRVFATGSLWLHSDTSYVYVTSGSGLYVNNTIFCASNISASGNINTTSGQIRDQSYWVYSARNPPPTPTISHQNADISGSYLNDGTLWVRQSWDSSHYVKYGATYDGPELGGYRGAAIYSASTGGRRFYTYDYQVRAHDLYYVTLQPTSSRAIKRDILDFKAKDPKQTNEKSPKEKLKALRPVRYKMAKDWQNEDPEQVTAGFVAEEVALVYPEAARVGQPDGMPSYDLMYIVAALTTAVQELIADVEVLSAHPALTAR